MLTDIFCSMTDFCFHYIMHLKVPLQQQYTKMSIIHVCSKLVDRWSHKNIVLPFSLHKKYIFLSVIVVVWTKNMLTPIRRPFRKKYINNFIWFCSISMPYDRMKVAFYCPLLFSYWETSVENFKSMVSSSLLGLISWYLLPLLLLWCLPLSPQHHLVMRWERYLDRYLTVYLILNKFKFSELYWNHHEKLTETQEFTQNKIYRFTNFTILDRLDCYLN